MASDVAASVGGEQASGRRAGPGVFRPPPEGAMRWLLRALVSPTRAGHMASHKNGPSVVTLAKTKVVSTAARTRAEQ